MIVAESRQTVSVAGARLGGEHHYFEIAVGRRQRIRILLDGADRQMMGDSAGAAELGGACAGPQVIELSMRAA
ncbi:hypothetical protein ABIA39_003352 [Nocardia sp. GAS34]|uniref:hypothetical protein n=1 Tax=unclassified Nocardia TaxID=2637762 RepID=UPI003D210B60